MYKLRLNAGENTETLLQFITSELDDEILDEMEVQREYIGTSKLVSEPITAAVAFTTISVTGMIMIARLVERWLEAERQRKSLEILADTALKNTEAGKVLAGAVEKHSDVALKYELPNRATFQQ
jgi:uncharacterized protein YfeS